MRAEKKPPEETPERGFLQIAVSESHAGLMKAEAEAFMRLYPDAHITILPVQTREAIVHLLNDSVPAIVVDRKFNAEEEKVASETKIRHDTVLIAKDAMAVVVNLFNNLETVSMEQLASVLNGTRTDWGRLPGSGLSGAILTVMTGANSGAYELVKNRLFRTEEGIHPESSGPIAEGGDRDGGETAADARFRLARLPEGHLRPPRREGEGAARWIS